MITSLWNTGSTNTIICCWEKYTIAIFFGSEAHTGYAFLGGRLIGAVVYQLFEFRLGGQTPIAAPISTSSIVCGITTNIAYVKFPSLACFLLILATGVYFSPSIIIAVTRGTGSTYIARGPLDAQT